MDKWTALREQHPCSMNVGPNPCTELAYWEIITNGADVQTREEIEIHAQTCREHLEFRLVVHELLLSGTFHHIERHYI